MCCRCRGSRDDRAPPGAGVCGECAALGVSDLERMVGMAMSDDWGKMMYLEKHQAAQAELNRLQRKRVRRAMRRAMKNSGRPRSTSERADPSTKRSDRSSLHRSDR